MTTMTLSDKTHVKRTIDVAGCFSFPFRVLLLAHIRGAGGKGLRPSVLAERTGRTPDLVAKHLRVLSDNALVGCTLSREEDGRIASWYGLLPDGEAWMVRLGFAERQRLIPALHDLCSQEMGDPARAPKPQAKPEPIPEPDSEDVQAIPAT
ncbi:MAG: hypothetical protein QOI63_1493 [Thermoplasmata archaeon]|jgi:hypothetical protein|nr:hypothetical protein [Thermoplasmata archaeon]